MKTEASGSSTSDHFKLAWRWVFSTTRVYASRLREAINSILSLRSVLLIVLAVLLLHLFGFILLPFWPFTTTGTIYVDSPEVYTRERLVNDRYDQDYWLRERLKMLNKPEELQLVIGEQLKSTTVGAGESGQQEGKATAPNEDRQVTDVPRRLSFEQEFRVASGIRDMIRQQILENMLDDRHDLTGNSVFGLKFDTTVIPGNNTHRRAFVHVALKIDDLFLLQFPDEGKDRKNTNGRFGNAQKEFGAHIDGWMATRFLPFQDEEYHEKNRAGIKKIEKFRKQEKHYLDWLADVKRRLNLAEDSMYDSLVKSQQGSESESAFSTECMNDVELDETITLPDPWDKFFIIGRKPFSFTGELDGSSQKGPRVWFDVRELTETFVIDTDPLRSSEEQGAEGSAVGDPRSVDELPAPVQQNEDEGIVTEFREDSTPDHTAGSACDPRSVRFFYNLLTGKTLEIVLGIPEEMFWRLNDPSLKNYGASEARARLTDELTQKVEEDAPAAESSVEAETDVPSAAQEESAMREEGKELIQVGTLQEGKWLVYVPSVEYQQRKSNFGKPSEFKYALTEDFVRWLIKQEEELLCKQEQQQEKALCDELQRKGEHYNPQLKKVKVDIMSGLFNFVERMSTRDAYPYAIFPKNDVVGIFAETSAQLSAAAPAAGFVDLAKHLTATTTAAVLTGYGDGRGGDLSIDFGWIISTPGEMEPTQKSQLALVSVPAWTEQLNLRVSVGWLDRHGYPEIDEHASFPLKIAVPPSYEVFDSIFREDVQVTLKPSIRDNEMDTDIYVRAGKETKILIPGSRLWRSTTVTLGAQTAKRITVLPNMEGIIAEFGPVAPPYAAYDVKSDPDTRHLRSPEAFADQDYEDRKSGDCHETIPYKAGSNLHVRPVRLRVWTSEGVALAKKRVCVVYDPEEILSESSSSTKATR